MSAVGRQLYARLAVDPNLLERARRGLLEGTLPSEDCRAFGGAGSGSACALCGEIIGEGSVEIELECDSFALQVTLHGLCHVVWMHARQMQLATTK